MVGVGQSVGRKISPEGIRQPMLGMSREERSNIPPQRMGRPNGNDNGASDKNGDPHDHGNGPDRRGGDLLEEMEIQVEEMEVLTLMIVGMEMILHPQQTLLLLEGEGTGSPNMFMCYKGLQDRQARKDNLDKQEEMGTHCHWLEP